MGSSYELTWRALLDTCDWIKPSRVFFCLFCVISFCKLVVFYNTGGDTLHYLVIILLSARNSFNMSL